MLKTLIHHFKTSLFILVSITLLSARGLASPTLWQVTDEDTTITIMGTLHILPDHTNWMTPAINSEIMAAHTIVLEVAPDQQTPAVMQAAIGKYGLLPPNESLKDHLSPATFKRVEAHFKGNPKAMMQISRLRPWYVGLQILIGKYHYEGFNPANGVDKKVQAIAMKARKNIIGLESADFQFQLLANLGADTDDIMLDDLLDDLPYVGNMTREMVKLWMGGNDGALGVMINKDLMKVPEAAEKILYARNRTWAGHVKSLMQHKGNFFMAVGAGHLSGRENLITLLKEQGLTVTKKGADR